MASRSDERSRVARSPPLDFGNPFCGALKRPATRVLWPKGEEGLRDSGKLWKARKQRKSCREEGEKRKRKNPLLRAYTRVDSGDRSASRTR